MAEHVVRSDRTRVDQSAVPLVVLARYHERFARLLGADDPYGWDENGPGFWCAESFASRTAGSKR